MKAENQVKAKNLKAEDRMHGDLFRALVFAGALIASTKCGALAFGLGGTKPAAEQQATTPQIQAAAQRVETAKTNLDLAHKRLEAAKALVRAAEAEYKAAKTDKDALVLNTQAQQLADASGLPKNGENVPANTANGGSTAEPNAAPACQTMPVFSTNENTIDSSALGAPTPSAQ